MSKKLDFVTVRDRFSAAGFTLLEPTYNARHVPMLCECKEGHIIRKAVSNLKAGCSECRKIGILFVKEEFLNSGIELLETEYMNNLTPMNCRCQCCQHLFKRTWANFKSGSRCPKCSFKSRYQSQPILSHEYVENFFNINGCELLSNYRVKDDKLKYRCVCGHVSETNFYSFEKSKQCVKCAKVGKNNPAWNPDRKSVAINKAFRLRCKTLLRNTLRSTGKKKDGKTKELLGYSNKELKEHLISHLEWTQLQNDSWHIDHIFPIKAFLDYGIKDLKIINCLDNLRPIKSRDNLIKSSKYNSKEFEEWLKGKGLFGQQ